MLVVAKSKQEIVKLKSLLSSEFDMPWDRNGKIWLSQNGYFKKVLERFSMLDAKPISTPLFAHFKLPL